MFEGKLPRREADPLLGMQSEGAALRPIDWHELTSRLAAARDARASLVDDFLLGGDASFDAGSAQRIAAQRDADHPVNPEDSGNLKDAGRNPGETSSADPMGAPRKI